MNQPSPNPPADRPDMPSYGILPAHEGSGLLPWSWVSERMQAARNYWIATTRPDGRPHVTPVWGVWVDDVFYFSMAGDSVKARNLAANPAMAVHLESGDETVILEGEVELVGPGETALLERLDAAYYPKYDFHILQGESNNLIVRLRARLALAWLESDYIGSATRWQLGGA